MRVLLVEDDRMIGHAIEQALTDAAYAVDWVTSGDLAVTAALTCPYDLILLDLGLPREDGLSVLRQVRRHDTTVPVVIVSARDEVDMRIHGLDLGADDYVPKPFDVHELLARMRAVARRRQGPAPALLGNGVVTLDPVTHEAEVADVRHRLSAREFALLQLLLRRPGTILSRSDLEARIYGWNEIDSNMVEVLIHGIRKKLGAAVIKNVRGVGWRVDRPA